MTFRPTCPNCGALAGRASAERCASCGGGLYVQPAGGTPFRAKAPTPRAVRERFPLRPGKRKQLLNAEKRKEYGCLTTWEHPDGRTFSIHRTGPVRAALRTAAAIALGEDESLRLASYSTPDTIFADLIGARVDAEHAPRGFKAVAGKSVPKPLPEVTMLALAGLPRELLHPRLRRHVKENRR